MVFNSELHCGNFSSSEIVRLTGSKKVRETYIAEKNMERRLGRLLRKDFYSKDTSWGHLMEYRVLTNSKFLGTEYSLNSTQTIPHPTVKGWVGSPDAMKHIIGMETVADIKGLQLKAFCEMIDAFQLGGIQKVREVCDSGDKFYYQLISNGCITKRNHGELILYCPYKSELEEIKQLALDFDGPDPGRFKWIAYATDDELPYLLDGGHYKNLNVLSFPLPGEERSKLHDTVVEATKELIPFKSLTPQPEIV